MKFKLFGVKFYISFLFCAIICFMLLTDKTGFFVPTLCAVILHEAGHLLVMWALDVPPTEVRFIPASVQIVRHRFLSDREIVITALSGPFLNLFAAACLYVNYRIYQSDFSAALFLINLLLGAFNLLPVCGLDGSTALYRLIYKKIGEGKATLTVRIFTFLFVAFAVAGGIICLFKGKLNPTFFVIAIYLTVSAFLGDTF